MAAYWKSPYRESSNPFRSPDHSTLRFEQSLYLSRSRSSVDLRSRFDWFDWRSRTGSDGNQPVPVTRSNTSVVKSILKTGRRESSVPKEASPQNQNTDDVTGSEKSEISRKERKRVTFGLTKCDVTERDENLPGRNSSKCPLATLKRISHSKMIEESALQKLNRLIGGMGQDESRSRLPSVKGQGLSPRPTNSKRQYKNACTHSPELKCVKCFQKDSQTRRHEKPAEGGLDLDFTVTGTQTIHSSDEKDTHAQLSGERYVLEGGCDVLADEEPTRTPQINNATSSRQQDGHVSQTRAHVVHSASSRSSTRNNVRLLPGRYQFASSAIHIKKLPVPADKSEDVQKGDDTAHVETSVITLLKDGALSGSAKGTHILPGNTKPADLSQAPPNSTTIPPDKVKAKDVIPNDTEANCVSQIDLKSNDDKSDGINIQANSGVSRRQPMESPSQKLVRGDDNRMSLEDGLTVTSLPVRSASVRKEKLTSEKTSAILDWLNNVPQTQPRTPHLVSTTL